MRLQRRLQRVAIRIEPPVNPQFRTFAAEVIRFGGHEPSPVAIEQLARWYAGGYRLQANHMSASTARGRAWGRVDIRLSPD